MEEFLGFVLELLFEAGFEFILGVIVAGAYRGLRHFRVTARRGNPIAATAVLVAVGLASGFLSVLVFPHPLVHPTRLHGISLIISPVITGLGMAAIGHGIRRRGRVPVKIESFGYGFAFAFSLALVRFLTVH